MLIKQMDSDKLRIFIMLITNSLPSYHRKYHSLPEDMTFCPECSNNVRDTPAHFATCPNLAGAITTMIRELTELIELPEDMVFSHASSANQLLCRRVKQRLGLPVSNGIATATDLHRICTDGGCDNNAWNARCGGRSRHILW